MTTSDDQAGRPPEGNQPGTAAGNPPEGTGTSPSSTGHPPEGNGPDAGDDGTRQERTPEQIEADLARARREAAGYRTRLREAEERLAALEPEPDVTEQLATTTAERDRLRLELLEIRTDGAIAEQARQLGYRNPTLAARLIRDRSALVGEDGTADTAAIRAELAELLKADPYLAAAAPASGDAAGRTPPGAPAGDFNARLRAGLANRTL